MKMPTKNLVLVALIIAPALHLTGCATAGGSVRKASAAASGGTVTVQQLGDTRVTTRRLINRPLTNRDSGKVYEEVVMESPRGRTVDHRIIVRAVPKLETKSVRVR